MAAPGLRIFGVPSGMRGDREEASHQARSLPLIPKANFILDRTDTFFASPVGRMANALATEVDVSGGEGPRGKVAHADLHAIATRLQTSAAQHQDRATPDPPCP